MGAPAVQPVSQIVNTKQEKCAKGVGRIGQQGNLPAM